MAFEFPYTPSNTSAATQAGLGVSRGRLPKQQPSTVQEWQHFIKLSPEDQARYLHMKRQGYVIKDVAGVPTMAPQIPGLPSVPLSNLQKEASAKATIEGAKEAAKTEAEASTKTRLDLPKAEAIADETLRLTGELKKHPGLSYSTGAWSMVPKIPGTQQADFISRHDQLKGRQFLQAYDMLKGGGQITEVEGKKAADAIGRMDRATSKDDYVKAVTDFEDAVRTGVSKLKEKAGKGQTPGRRKVGDIVQTKQGMMIIQSINPDGSYEAMPVR